MPVGRKAVWAPEDELALFGLLDFCIKHARVFPFTEENVVGRLCSAGSSHDGYTWDQINRKLNTLWGKFGRRDSVNKADMYVEGSTSFSLTEDERSAVESSVERLEELLKPVCLEPVRKLH